MSKTQNSTLTSTLYFLNYLKQRTGPLCVALPLRWAVESRGKGKAGGVFQGCPTTKRMFWWERRHRDYELNVLACLLILMLCSMIFWTESLWWSRRLYQKPDRNLSITWRLKSTEEREWSPVSRSLLGQSAQAAPREARKDLVLYIYVCMCVYMCVCIYVCRCVYMCVGVYICVYVCIYVCMCVYMCVGTYVCIYIHIHTYTFCFLGPHLQHMEVTRPGVQSELQLLAYTTATASGDLSPVCDLHHNSRQCQILNPLSKARDRTCILIDIRFISAVPQRELPNSYYWTLWTTYYVGYS